MSVNVGDWIAFYRDARIVYAPVRYIRQRSSWERCDTACTDEGAVMLDQVLEVRTAQEGGGIAGRREP